LWSRPDAQLRGAALDRFVGAPGDFLRSWKYALGPSSRTLKLQNLQPTKQRFVKLMFRFTTKVTTSPFAARLR
jgi:hypothetical protein